MTTREVNLGALLTGLINDQHGDKLRDGVTVGLHIAHDGEGLKTEILDTGKAQDGDVLEKACAHVDYALMENDWYDVPMMVGPSDEFDIKVTAFKRNDRWSLDLTLGGITWFADCIEPDPAMVAEWQHRKVAARAQRARA